METKDWAEEAHSFYVSYHQHILSLSKDNSKYPQPTFFPDDEKALKLLLSSPVLKQTCESISDLPCPSSENPFAKFEEVRGWDVILRRLPDPIYGSDGSGEGRMLTLCRRSVLGSLFPSKNEEEEGNIILVSRKKWALIELARWSTGHYANDAVLTILESELDEIDQRKSCPTMTKMAQLQITGTPTIVPGRHILLHHLSPPIAPGQILLSASPYASSPIDITTNSTCFHCCRDLSHSTSTQVRDLSLLCNTCHIAPFGYCSVKCRQRNGSLHQTECQLLEPLFRMSMIMEAERSGMAPFKALLVLRCAIRAQSDPEGWNQLQNLECCREDHLSNMPMFARHAEEMAGWIYDRLTMEDDGRSAISNDRRKGVTMIRDVFFAIHINSIGIGPNGVGLFPGLPSMFNHSCEENVTHSWDDYDDDDDHVPVLNFRAVEEIQPGDECTIGYVAGLHLPTEQRIADLKRYKFFTCRCKRCTSEDEGGKLEQVQRWKECVMALEKEDEVHRHGHEFVITHRRELCEIAERIFPTFFVTKGLCYEELGRALLNKEGDDDDKEQVEEAHKCFQKAREQYSICRGEKSPLVTRVDKVMEKDETNETVPFHDSNISSNFENAESHDDDLKFARGWSRCLFEIKTHEPFTAKELGQLSNQIHELQFKIGYEKSSACVKWDEGYRLYEIGYGILTLIISGMVNEFLISKEGVAEMIREMMDDIVQNVDIL